MSGLWKTTKSYSKSAAELAAAPVTFVGGLIGKGATVQSVSTATATTVGGSTVTTTTVTTATAGFAKAAAGVAAAAAAGTAVGQLINGGLSFFWDPEPIDTELEKFTQVQDAEVDAFLDRVFSTLAFVEALPDNELTVKSVIGGDEFIPDMGTTSINYARVALRTLVHVLRGAAFGTAGNEDEVRIAAQVVSRDLKEFAETMRTFAKLVQKNQTVSGLFPRISLEAYLDFIDDHRENGKNAIPAVEAAIISQIGELAMVSFREDFAERIARWVADGPDDGELAAFNNTHDKTLSIADVLLQSLVWCWSDFDLYASDYL